MTNKTALAVYALGIAGSLFVSIAIQHNLIPTINQEAKREGIPTSEILLKRYPCPADLFITKNGLLFVKPHHDSSFDRISDIDTGTTPEEIAAKVKEFCLAKARDRASEDQAEAENNEREQQALNLLRK